MKEILRKFITFATNITTLSSFVTLLAGYFAAHFGVLTKMISLPVWALILSISLPFISWTVIRLTLQRKKRTFKTGDHVSMLADLRDFVVYEYSIWQPLKVTIKENNGNEYRSISQHFLRKYQEPEPMEKVIDIISKLDKQPPKSKLIHL